MNDAFMRVVPDDADADERLGAVTVSEYVAAAKDDWRASVRATVDELLNEADIADRSERERIHAAARAKTEPFFDAEMAAKLKKLAAGQRLLH